MSAVSRACLLLAALAPSLSARSHGHRPQRPRVQRPSPAAAHAADAPCSANPVRMLGRFPLPPSSYQLRARDGSCIMGTLCDDMDAYFAARKPYDVDPHVVDIITSALYACPFEDGGCRAVDIGANMGTMTMAMLQMKSTVFAVEPQADLCASTRATVACSGLAARATVHCAAIASSADKASGKAEIVLDTSQLFRFGQPVARRQTTVPLLRLEEVVPPGAYRVIKVDTDAIDCDILAQLARMIQAGSHDVSSMVFESNSCSLQAGDVLHELQGMGYTVYRTLLWERTFDGTGGQASPLGIDRVPAYAVERFDLRYNRYLWELKPMSRAEWRTLAGSKVWQYLVTRDSMVSSPLAVVEKT